MQAYLLTAFDLRSNSALNNLTVCCSLLNPDNLFYPLTWVLLNTWFLSNSRECCCINFFPILLSLELVSPCERVSGRIPLTKLLAWMLQSDASEPFGVPVRRGSTSSVSVHMSLVIELQLSRRCAISKQYLSFWIKEATHEFGSKWCIICREETEGISARYCWPPSNKLTLGFACGCSTLFSSLDIRCNFDSKVPYLLTYCEKIILVRNLDALCVLWYKLLFLTWALDPIFCLVQYWTISLPRTSGLEDGKTLKPSAKNKLGDFAVTVNSFKYT